MPPKTPKSELFGLTPNKSELNRRRARAAAGSALFLAAAPGLVAGLYLGRPVLLAYAIVFGATVYAFVRGYEEPTLETRYGAEYERYRAAVPGWWPRLSARRAPPGPR